MNIKLLKAQSILQEALQEALFDLEDMRLKNIAVTRVECTRGREMAKVFLDENSLGDMGANDALKLLKKASGAIRANLQAQLSWYKTPNLVFEIDRTLNEINKLESIFKKIHSKGENSSLGEGNSPLELHSVDSHEAIQNKNQSRDSATESRPIRGAKNREQGRSSASADFLLESELRGTPPKSEKRQLLARRGSGAGGAALLRKEKDDKDSIDLKVDLIAESHKKIDSRFSLDSRDLDSSRCRAQNDEGVKS